MRSHVPFIMKSIFTRQRDVRRVASSSFFVIFPRRLLIVRRSLTSASESLHVSKELFPSLYEILVISRDRDAW